MVLDKVCRLLRRFRQGEEGAVAIMAGLSALPMMVVAGMAVDFVQANGAQTRLQAALDAAALAAASSEGLNTRERIELGQAVFAKNWQDEEFEGITASADFTIRNGGLVADATVDMPTSFMQLIGYNSVTIGADVEISIPKRKKAEVALVLDYSRSMFEVSGGKVKYIAMRDAAIKLVDDLSKAGKNKVMIGLVPFSHQLRVTLPNVFVRGEKGSGTWTGCTQDRRYPYNLSDETPRKKDEDTKWNQDVLTEHGGCGGYGPRKLAVRPLTSDFDRVTRQLEDMRPYEYTHIALGVEFGWHLLSPNAPFSEGAAYTDEGTEKFMVVLTDGRQTEKAFGPKGSRTEDDGEDNLETLCERAKDKGITMVTIAFDLRDKDTADRLSACSTDSDKYYFVAETGEDLARAFEEIKTQITAKVFVSK